MKQIKKFLVKVSMVVVLIAILFGGYKFFEWQSVTEVVNNVSNAPVPAPSPSEYEERVVKVMEDTADQWEEKHRVWAEQEVSKEIIAEQEARLEKLREKELSL